MKTKVGTAGPGPVQGTATRSLASRGRCRARGQKGQHEDKAGLRAWLLLQMRGEHLERGAGEQRSDTGLQVKPTAAVTTGKQQIHGQ